MNTETMNLTLMNISGCFAFLLGDSTKLQGRKSDTHGSGGGSSDEII